MSESEQWRRPRPTEGRRRGAAPDSSVTEFRTRSATTAPTTIDLREVPAHSGQEPPASGVLEVLKRTRALSATLVVVGLGAGLGWAWHTPDVYTAETRLAVGSQELSAQAVPGYVLALQTMTSNYARYVQTTSTVRKELVTSLGPSAARIVGVAASPIPDSSVLRIEVQATDPAVAVKAADLIGRSMVSQVAGAGSAVDPVLKKLSDVSTAAASADQAQKAAQSAVDGLVADRAPAAKITAARQAVVDASAKAEVLDVQQQALAASYQNALQNSGQPATLTTIRRAALTFDDGTSSLERLGAFGLLAGAVCAVGVAFLRDRTRRVRPSGADRASAGPALDWTREESGDAPGAYAAR